MNGTNPSKTFGIYQIVNLITGSLYIGSTVRSFSKRWHDWKRNLEAGKKCNPHLFHAFQKYGKENFKFLILEVIEDRNQVLEREQYWIDQLLPYYNICPIAGSRLGSTTSEETRRKISEANKGRVKDESWRQALSKAKRGVPTGPSPNKGKIYVDRRCSCGLPCRRGGGKILKTCGRKECVQKTWNRGHRRGVRSAPPCPICSNPRKECYNRDGKFLKYQATCGAKRCITKRRWPNASC